MLLAEKDLAGVADDMVAQDPEVRQARKIADAARSRLLSCIAGSQEAVDTVQAQRIFDMLWEAQALVEDAEDRVLVHRGLLNPAEAERRATVRRPAAAGAAFLSAPGRAQDPTGVTGPARPGVVARCAEAGTRALQRKPGLVPNLPPAARHMAASVIVHALIPAAAGFAGAAIARRRR